MFEVILLNKMPSSWIRDISVETKSTLRLIDLIPDEGSGGHFLFEMNADEKDINSILKIIRSHKQIDSVELFPYRSGVLIGSIMANDCVTCNAIRGLDCFLVFAQYLDNGQIEWEMILDNEETLGKVISRMENEGCIVTIKSKTQIHRRNILTDRQEEVIRTAFDMGYFDYPKKVGLKELSYELNIASSTINEILHRGERKIIRDHLFKKL